MKREKILIFIKKNKVGVGIVGSILSIGILTSIGYGIYKLTSDNKPLAVARNEENKPNNIIQSDNATSSLSEDENKKDEQATNESVENQNNSENVTKNNNMTNDANSNNKKNNSENNKKYDEKKSDNKKPNSNGDGKATVTITTNSKVSSSSGSNGTSNGTSQTTNSSSSSHNNITNIHSHSWTPVKKVVHHKEQGHYENVLVKTAWTEKVPVYEEQAIDICNGCGKDITKNPTEHNMNHMLNGEKGGWHTEWKNVQVGTKTVKHEAVYKKKWVVDKKAYDETIITGYKCSCGATK